MSYAPRHKNLPLSPRVARLLFFLLLTVLFLASCHSTKKAGNSNTSKAEENAATLALQEKYAPLLSAEKKELSNTALLKFMDEWYGVPYKYGGKDKNGVDCSSFTCQLINTVYGKNISGSSKDLYEKTKKVKESELKEGDLLFFKTDGNKISHVGVYIMKNKFVHATTKKGVMLNDLDEAYYKKTFCSAGRIE